MGFCFLLLGVGAVEILLRITFNSLDSLIFSITVFDTQSIK